MERGFVVMPTTKNGPAARKTHGIKGRKSDHIRINLEEDVRFKGLTTGLENWYFMHQALPDLDLASVDHATTMFGKRLQTPLLISSMTGGTEQAHDINRTLAAAAQQVGMAMALGSQRAALQNPRLAFSYRVRDVAPDILLFANIGAVQLNYGFGSDECRRAVEMCEADGLILHLNALQEAVQPEGDGNFACLLPKIAAVCRDLPVPVIAKEVGWGISRQAARQLVDAGVSAIDVAGAGGTSWSQVEMHRAATQRQARIAAAFIDWGIPTAESIQYCRSTAPELPIFASGGIRTGIEVAKCIALGADLAGIAGDFLRAAVQGQEAVVELADTITTELRIAMLCAAAADLNQMKKTPLYRRS